MPGRLEESGEGISTSKPIDFDYRTKTMEDDLNAQFGPGASYAEGIADHDNELIGEIYGEIGYPDNDKENAWGEALILAALVIGRREGEEREREKWIQFKDEP